MRPRFDRSSPRDSIPCCIGYSVPGLSLYPCLCNFSIIYSRKIGLFTRVVEDVNADQPREQVLVASVSNFVQSRKKHLTFAFYSPIVPVGRGNGKRVALAPLPSGSHEPNATR
jgi:hypothetical protein